MDAQGRKLNISYASLYILPFQKQSYQLLFDGMREASRSYMDSKRSERDVNMRTIYTLYVRGVKDDIDSIHLPEALMAIIRRVAALAKICIVVG